MESLIIHSTLTECDIDLGVESIALSHKGDEDLMICSFQDVIKLDGTIHSAIEYNPKRIDNWIYKEDYERLRGKSRHVAYVGGVVNGFTNNTLNEKQSESLKVYVKYMTLRHPGLEVLGYSNVSGYDSEGFNVNMFLKKNKI
tara:strand:- start:794 stop:1219 length:426 start_codon:yes stop_codon:yes gene_type:complete